ncbi:hypothetical protein [Roseobacter sp. HKCCA0882]|uniref:hypothetical protein n=1 Tax=Roseobacter sp. HKCCA0882 TaxID=3120337 RepID=UPI0030EB4E30
MTLRASFFKTRALRRNARRWLLDLNPVPEWQGRGMDQAARCDQDQRPKECRYAKAYPKHTSVIDQPLIYSGKGGGFTAQTMVNLFQKLYRLAAIDGASSHSGRRQFLTKLADKGVNARVVRTCSFIKAKFFVYSD